MRVWSAAKAAYNVIVDPRYRYYYWQRRIEDIAERDRAAAKIALTLPRYDGPRDQDSATLDREGILHLPSLLDDQALSEMRDYFAARPAADPYRPELGAFIGPEAAPSATHVAFFSNEIVVHAPHALEVANHPRILSAVSAVLGAKPTISYMTAWWSLPAGGAPEHAELYHRDYDDLRFIKLFLYLTDVDDTNGPHAFVRGSHRSDKLVERVRFTEEDVAACFAPEDRLRMAGKAGTAFLENTFGLHRGIPPVSKPRLIFQVLYSLAPYIGGPRKPLRSVAQDSERSRFDPYVNRAYCTLG
jgi:hypothetical protein